MDQLLEIVVLVHELIYSQYQVGKYLASSIWIW